MGYSSYKCKHCEHSVISDDAVTAGVNEWMAEVVMLTRNGSRRAVSTYSGYEGHYEEFADEAVWVHKACWELNGEPEYDNYDGPSAYDPEQGMSGPEHDQIDPRITDPAERNRLLEEGISARNKRREDARAMLVHDWNGMSNARPHHQKNEDWRFRYLYRTRTNGTFTLVDIFHEIPEEEKRFEGTEEEVQRFLAAKWETFVTSDEYAAFLVRAEEIFAETEDPT